MIFYPKHDEDVWVIREVDGKEQWEKAKFDLRRKVFVVGACGYTKDEVLAWNRGGPGDPPPGDQVVV